MRGCRPLTDAEIARVLGALAGPTAARDRALFLLGLKAGFRVSELLSLRLGDVFQAGRIAARVTVARRHVKGRTAGRTVLLHPAAKAALAAWVFALRQRGGPAGAAFVAGKMPKVVLVESSFMGAVQIPRRELPLAGDSGRVPSRLDHLREGWLRQVEIARYRVVAKVVAGSVLRSPGTGFTSPG